MFASSRNKDFTLANLAWITVATLSKYLHQPFKKSKELHHYRLLLNIAHQAKIFESNANFTQYWALDCMAKLKKITKMAVWWVRKFGKSFFFFHTYNRFPVFPIFYGFTKILSIQSAYWKFLNQMKFSGNT